MSDAPTLLVRDVRFQAHAGAPGHPECPERLSAVDRALDLRPELGVAIEPRLALDEEIVAIHAAQYYDALGQLAGKATQLDADTFMAPRSFEVARLAVGGALELADRIVRGEASQGFALVRPPGHHAERGRAMGFCLLNQIAIVAANLRARAGLERIAIVDWDVHHGNGTQHAFEAERDVLFVSTHQFPFYPGTGALSERGTGAGEGATLNLPLPAGCGDAEYQAAFSEVVVPALADFKPDMILVSAGFDAHALDPLASMQVSTETYATLTACLREVAEAHCGGRMLFFLEGGYHLEALPASVIAVLEQLARPGLRHEPAERTPLAARLIELFREAHGGSWPSLRRIVHSG